MVYLIAFFSKARKAIVIASPEAITKYIKVLFFRTNTAITIIAVINRRIKMLMAVSKFSVCPSLFFSKSTSVQIV